MGLLSTVYYTFLFYKVQKWYVFMQSSFMASFLSHAKITVI